MQKALTTFSKKALPVALATGALAFGSVAARADVMAIGTNQLSNFTISTSSGSLSLDPNSPASRNSVANATYNGTGPSTSQTVTPPAAGDAPTASAGPGPFPTNNAGYDQGSTLAFTGGFGDSNVFGNFLTTGSTVNTTGQAHLPGATPGSATGSGRVATAGSILLTLTGTTSATFTISFTDDFNLFVSSDMTGGTAQATSTASFTIRDTTDAIVFSFVPNGAPGGNGANTSETLDTANLNTELSALGNESNTLNPGSSSFSAFTTNPLSAGTYRLDLLVANNAVVSQAAIPEPSSVLLTALGLTAAGFVTRRRKPRA